MSHFIFKRQWVAIVAELDAGRHDHNRNLNFKRRLVAQKRLQTSLDDRQRRLTQQETELDIKQARLERCEKELEQARCYFVDLWDDVHERQAALKEDEKLLREGEKLLAEKEKRFYEQVAEREASLPKPQRTVHALNVRLDTSNVKQQHRQADTRGARLDTFEIISIEDSDSDETLGDSLLRSLRKKFPEGRGSNAKGVAKAKQGVDEVSSSELDWLKARRASVEAQLD